MADAFTGRVTLIIDEKGAAQTSISLKKVAESQNQLGTMAVGVDGKLGKFGKTLTNVGFAAAGIPGPLGRIASSLGGIVNPATAVVAVIGLIVARFIAAKEAAEKYGKTLETIADLEFKLGRISAAEYQAKLKREADSARLDVKLATERRANKLKLGGLIGLTAQSPEEIAELEQIALTKENAHFQAVKDDKERLQSLETKAGREAERFETERLRLIQAQLKYRQEEFNLINILRQGFKSGPLELFPTIGRLSPVSGPGSDFKPLSDRRRDTGGEFIEQFRKDQPEIALGLEALGDTLSSSLGGAFEDVFGEANSLLEQFAQRLVEVLGANLINGLINLAFPGAGLTSIFDFGKDAAGNSLRIEKALGNPTVTRAQTRVNRQHARLGIAA